MLQSTIQPVWEGLADHKWSDVRLAELDQEMAKLDFLADYEFIIRADDAQPCHPQYSQCAHG